MSQFVLNRSIIGRKAMSLSPLRLAVRAPTRGHRDATGGGLAGDRACGAGLGAGGCERMIRQGGVQQTNGEMIMRMVKDRTAVGGRISSVYLSALFLAGAVVMAPSTAYAACGDHNEKACCACDDSRTCKSGLFEICGCDSCVGCNTGGCTNGDYCYGFGQSNGYCVDLHPCGGPDQRACCVNESFPACDPGYTEQGSCKDDLGRKQCGCAGGPLISGGVCKPVDCGNDGQRACCTALGEQAIGGGACNPGLFELLGCEGSNCGCSISHCKATTHCGAEGERGCCTISDPGVGCDSGVFEISSPTCRSQLGDDACLCSEILGIPVYSDGVCKATTHCGDAGERACCILSDPGVGCNSGSLLEISTPSCRNQLGNDACLCSEILGVPVYSDGTCIQKEHCGGLDQRACCFLEDLSIGACEGGLIENAGCGERLPDTSCLCSEILGVPVYALGRCVEPDCGGEGERACCLLERIPSCDSGLIEDLSPAGPFTDCEDVLGAGNCDCGYGPGKSLGVCRDLKGLGETGCDIIFDPCASGLMCMATGTGTICVPVQGKGLFGNAVCAAFYNPTIHQGAIAAGVTLSFGTGASASVVATGSVEIGVAYGADGCYGCYFTKCYGVETDIAIGVAACTGQGFDGLFSSVEGDSCVLTVGADFPFLEIGGSVSSEWDGSGFEDCHNPPEPAGISECFSVGLGINPVTLAYELCNTVTNLVACQNDESGDLDLTPDEPPACLAGSTILGCPGSSIGLTPIALDPDGDPLTYSWSTDCPGGTFDDNTLAAPTLSFNPALSCAPLNCTVTLTADGFVTVDETTTPVQVVCPASVVSDSEAPEFTSFPDDVTIDCTDPTDSSNTGGDATAMDACDGSPTVAQSDSISGCAAGERFITRTWTVSDACGNSRSQDQTITVVDATAPSIDTQASNSTEECDGAGNAAALNVWLGSQGGAEASDSCGSVTWSNDFTALSNGCGETGGADVVFTATDECGHPSRTVATFTIEDTTDPIITCPENATVECTDPTDPSATGVATGTDVCDQHPLSIIWADVDDLSGCNGTGTITRTWKAEDACGNSASCDQVITVVDTVAPNVTCPAGLVVQLPDSTYPSATGEATATDNCDTAPVITSSDVDSDPAAFCPTINIITRTWTATDACGNASSCDQIVDVHDEIPGGICHPCCGIDGADTCREVREEDCGADFRHFVGETCSGDNDGDGYVDVCDTCAGADDHVFVDCRGAIPTASEWGLIALALLLLIGSKVLFGRGRRLGRA